MSPHRRNRSRCRRGPMAVHVDAATGLPSRVLGRGRRPHVCTGDVPRVLQPAASLGTVDHDELRRPSDDLQEHRPSQRQHQLPVHALPVLPVRYEHPRSGHRAHDDSRIVQRRPRNEPVAESHHRAQPDDLLHCRVLHYEGRHAGTWIMGHSSVT